MTTNGRGPLDGKVAIVTGGGGGLGGAVSAGLAGLGAKVAINFSRSKGAADAVAAAIRDAGAEAMTVQGSVAEDADCRRVAAAVLERWGRIDILVNNAATTTRMAPHDDLEALSADDFLASYRVNLIGAYQMIRACRPAMQAQGGGAVVNISSVSALNGGGSSIAYSASKAALNAMSQSLARSLGPEIRVNTVSPGFMETPWFANALPPEKLQMIIERQRQMTPLRRSGTPDDILPAVLFLAGEGSMHMTGANLVVDAGFQLGAMPTPLTAKPGG